MSIPPESEQGLLIWPPGTSIRLQMDIAATEAEVQIEPPAADVRAAIDARNQALADSLPLYWAPRWCRSVWRRS